MNTLIESYGLPYEGFRTALQESHGLVSGSAALALYLAENSVEAGFVPHDIDIWFPVRKNILPMVDFLFDHGYVLLRLHHHHVPYANHLHKLVSVFTFTKGGYDGECYNIQLIRVEACHMVDYVIQHFDLSVCMTWWNANEERCETFLPELTLQKHMLVSSSGGGETEERRSKERMEKYTTRGFKVVESPPPWEERLDVRGEGLLSSWKDVMAFDVWRYEDIEAADHLRSSDWNILLRVGEAWYAVERRTLRDYMGQHGVLDSTYGRMYDTPYRHRVTEEACQALSVGDDSVFELVEAGQGGDRTLYTMRTYSLEGWRTQEPRRIYSPRACLLSEADRDAVAAVEAMEDVVEAAEDVVVAAEAEVEAMNAMGRMTLSEQALYEEIREAVALAMALEE